MLVWFGTVMLRENGDTSFVLTVPKTAVAHSRLEAKAEVDVFVERDDDAKPEDCGRLVFAKRGTVAA